MLSPNLRPVPADSDGALVHVSPLSYSFPLNSSALIDHHFVNSSIKALKFDAAASFQLPHVHKDGCEHNGTEESPGLLVVSPYVSQAHLLDLSTVSRPSQLFAKALTVMKPVHDGYATASYTESFNWGDIMGVLEDLVKVDEFHWRELAFYVIVFRSQVSPATDRSHLGALDAQSHAEAMISGGLLKYWFGEPDIDGRNLATCIWRSREDAKAGGTGAGHVLAMRAAKGLYIEYKVERLRFIISQEIRDWRVEDWHD